MIGAVAGRVTGSPSPSNPSSTCGSAKSASTSPASPSRVSAPRSTCCMAAALANTFVIEWMLPTVSTVIGAPDPSSRSPAAPR